MYILCIFNTQSVQPLSCQLLSWKRPTLQLFINVTTFLLVFSLLWLPFSSVHCKVPLLLLYKKMFVLCCSCLSSLIPLYMPPDSRSLAGPNNRSLVSYFFCLSLSWQVKKQQFQQRSLGESPSILASLRCESCQFISVLHFLFFIQFLAHKRIYPFTPMIAEFP